MTYKVSRVDFDDLDLVLRIFKARGLRRADVLACFSAESNRRAVIERYHTIEPIDRAAAMALPDVNQRGVALSAVRLAGGPRTAKPRSSP